MANETNQDADLGNLGMNLPSKEDMLAKLKEEIDDVNKRLEKHSGNASLQENLKKQKAKLTEQLELMNDFPDMLEIFKKIQDLSLKLTKTGNEMSKLKDEYIDLLDK